MNNLNFVLEHFFTHKDYLVQAENIPGTLFTPLHLTFEFILIFIIISGAVYVSRRKQIIIPVFKFLLFSLIIFEIAIDAWESIAGAEKFFDLSISLPLYPCSIFMFVLPFVIWNKGLLKYMACGYICTLGIVGALINFIYPTSRLLDYSCISFPAFHTFFYHGSMLFTALVLIMSGMHKLDYSSDWKLPLLSSVPGLIMSVPANMVNFSPVKADYMYFTGQHPLSKMIFGNNSALWKIMLVMYAAYLIGPPLFYWLPHMVKVIFKAISERKYIKIFSEFEKDNLYK